MKKISKKNRKFIWKNKKLLIKKRKLKFKKKLSLSSRFYKSLIILIFAFMISLNYPSKDININTNVNANINSKEIIEDNKYYFNETIFEVAEKSKEFFRLTNDGILLNKIPEEMSKEPKFSVVVPVFSVEKWIKRTIRSAQNQNFTDIEIVLIDDFSKDNSLKIMEEMSKEDPRIKLIKNNENKGTLYSRCIGALMSKGKYILPMDSDDMFLNTDFFYILNQEVEKMDVDIIKYRAIMSNNYLNPLNKRAIKVNPPGLKENKVLYQPELGIFGDKFCVLWIHCIRTEFYKEKINLYGKMNNYANFLEDCIMHFILYQTAKSLKLFLKLGYLHIGRPLSSSRISNKTEIIKAKILQFEAEFDFAKYTTITRDISVKNIIEQMKLNEFPEILKDNKTKNYIIDFMKRVIANKNITNESRESIIQECLKFNLHY